MKAFYLLGIVAVFTACSSKKIQTHTENGYTFTSFRNEDHSIGTYVNVGDSMAVVFRSKGSGTDPFTGINFKCLVCVVSHITECANQVCPGHTPGCSDQIRECAEQKCRDSHECETIRGTTWAILRIN